MKNYLAKTVACVVASVLQNLIVEIVFLKFVESYLTYTKRNL